MNEKSQVMQAVQAYVDAGSNEVEGWFYRYDMLLFSLLDNIQKSFEMQGEICELGVYKGKSLILLNLMSRATESVYAFDLFDNGLLDETKTNMALHADVQGLGEVKYIVGDSSEYTVDNLKEVFQKPLRLLHIDAGHEYHEVLQSLYAFAPFVSNQGVIIMDDYQDRDFPGIEAAVHQFCSVYSPRRFVPFFAGGNKMCLCTAAIAEQFQRSLVQNEHLIDKCRLSRIDDYFVLIGDSKIPMKNTAIEELLSHQFVPYEYDVDMDYLRKQASGFSQVQLNQW